jgi:type IV secretion system protein VirD4
VIVVGAVALAVFGLVASAVLVLLLGSPLGDVVPWQIAEHVLRYGFTGAAQKACTAGAVSLVLLPLAWVTRTQAVDLGSARFARWWEVRAAGLFAPMGIVLGKLGRRYLRSDAPQHVLVAAPTRSGKGVGIVIPNLLAWPGSAIVLDIKGENFQVTSGFREKHGQAVFRFSPADPEGRSHCYNPLDAVRKEGADRISDLQRLAAILLPTPAGSRDAFWQEEGRSLFLGIALYVLDTPGIPHTLGQIYRTLAGEEPLEKFLPEVLKTRQNLDPACRLALRSFLQKASKERSGVRSTLAAALGLWANPRIDAATAKSDFDLGAMRRHPMTIYVSVSLDQLGALQRLLNLFFQQAILLMAQSMPGPQDSRRVLLLLDEFASLGRMEVLKDSLAFLAGYGVRVCTIVQGLGQLDDLYGRAGRESILQNCALQVLFAANDRMTAEYASERLGLKTIQTVSRTTAGLERRAAKSTGWAARPLLLPQEVRSLGAEEALVLQEGAWPIRARKIRYHREPAFQRRLLAPAAVPLLEVQTETPEEDAAAERLRAAPSAAARSLVSLAQGLGRISEV